MPIDTACKYYCLGQSKMFSMLFFLLGCYLGWQAHKNHSEKLYKFLGYLKNPKLLFRKKSTKDLDKLG